MKLKSIHAAANAKLIAFAAPVTIKAAQGEGDKKGPPTFDVVAYTGVPMQIAGYGLPVVIDLAGLNFGKSLVANLDHNPSQRVGHVTQHSKTDGQLILGGVASAATPARDEVINSAADGFQWQASVEVQPEKIVELAAGKTAEVNGQTITGPAYITRKGTLKGFAFVSHGADDNTNATIAAIAASQQEKVMEPELKKWIEAMGFVVADLSEDQLAGLKANYEGYQLPKKAAKGIKADAFDAKEAEFARQDSINEIALNACDKRPYDIKAIKELTATAIEGKWTVEKFRLELLEASLPPAHTVFRTKRDERLSNAVIEAAICQAGRLEGHEKAFDAQTLQLAHDRFRGRIGLKQVFLLAAQANGYHEHNLDVTLDVQRAAFSMQGPRQIQAQGWSTIDISTIISNTANKFIMRGWNMVDRTCLNVAKIQNVRDFKTATTVSLTDSVLYEKVGAAGEIKHGTLGELSYTVKADTYAKMLAITRQDIINDDLGALTDVPMKLGNGAIKKLNDIFWTEFLALVGASFFAAGNSNINTGVADMTVGGLDATETIFMNQTNPDGTPLGVMARILLVPTALKNKALALVADSTLITGASATIPSQNIFAGRFRVESSPYISNSSYSGYTSTGWWMLSDPNELPVIAIAALNGRVEPTVETADADFNVLGVQMRGYSDVGVNRQEYRGGVYADGGSS